MKVSIKIITVHAQGGLAFAILLNENFNSLGKSCMGINTEIAF